MNVLRKAFVLVSFEVYVWWKITVRRALQFGERYIAKNFQCLTINEEVIHLLKHILGC